MSTTSTENYTQGYTMTTAIISLQWNPFSDYMQTPQEELSRKRFRNLLCSSHNLYQKFGKRLQKIDFKTGRKNI
jgi:hypothetical protein